MIGLAVWAFAGTVPVEVDDVAGSGDVGDGLAGGVGVGGVLPAVAVFEPLDMVVPLSRPQFEKNA